MLPPAPEPPLFAPRPLLREVRSRGMSWMVLAAM